MDKEMLDIAINLRKKYNKISELLDITQQMTDCINRNDMVSFKIFINMRTEILLEIEEINENQEKFLSLLEPRKAENAKALMQSDAVVPDNTPSEDLKVYSTFMDCKSATAKLVAMDKAMSEKICGDKSFYHLKNK